MLTLTALRVFTNWVSRWTSPASAWLSYKSAWRRFGFFHFSLNICLISYFWISNSNNWYFPAFWIRRNEDSSGAIMYWQSVIILGRQIAVPSVVISHRSWPLDDQPSERSPPDGHRNCLPAIQICFSLWGIGERLQYGDWQLHSGIHRGECRWTCRNLRCLSSRYCENKNADSQ